MALCHVYDVSISKKMEIFGIHMRTIEILKLKIDIFRGITMVFPRKKDQIISNFE